MTNSLVIDQITNLLTRNSMKFSFGTPKKDDFLITKDVFMIDNLVFVALKINLVAFQCSFTSNC